MTPNLKICSVLALCVGLSGCGGGGDSSPIPSSVPAPALIPAPAPVVLAPLTSVPPPTYGDARAQALNRVNDIRRQVGLGLLAQNDKLDVAAQGHADYLISNRNASHFQTEGLPGFTGNTAVDRTVAAGYAAGVSSAPTIDEALIPGLPNSDLRQTVDSFLDAIYHRIPFLNHASIDIGMGLKSAAPVARVDMFVIDFGYHQGRRQGSPATPYVVWPQPDSVIGRLDNPSEIPAPPGLGYGPSIHVDPSRVLKVQSFEMRDASGRLVPATILSTATDPFLRGRAYAVLLSPALRLTAATRYTVQFTGTSDDQPLRVDWSFRTP